MYNLLNLNNLYPRNHELVLFFSHLFCLFIYLLMLLLVKIFL